MKILHFVGFPALEIPHFVGNAALEIAHFVGIDPLKTVHFIGVMQDRASEAMVREWWNQALTWGVVLLSERYSRRCRRDGKIRAFWLGGRRRDEGAACFRFAYREAR